MKELTLQSYFYNGIKRFTHNPAITCLDKDQTITYSELNLSMDQIASYLIDLGVKINTKVLIVIPNSIEFIAFSLGAMRCGATVLSAGENLSSIEIEYILNDSEPTVVIVGTDSHIEAVYKYASINSRTVTAVGVNGFNGSFPDGFKVYEAGQCFTSTKPQNASPNDLAGLFYTGGTTGKPKAVMHSQYSIGMALLANCLENPFDDRDKVLFSTPLQHAAGMLLWRSLITGAHTFITRTFEADKYLKTIEANKITTAFVVPTMLYRLIDQQKKAGYDLRSLRTITYGTSPIYLERLKEAIELFGPVFKQHYGQTECPLLVTRLTKSDHFWAYNNDENVLKSCGKPSLLSQIRFVDDDGNDVSADDSGEIIVKAPYNTVGYYKNSEITEEVIKDGWLYTGDIGRLDDNQFIYIVDRKKDMIISGGHNIYPAEVENIINKHPDVLMNACVGIPHPDWGEALCALVSLKENTKCEEEDIKAFCKKSLTGYKVPKVVRFMNNIPLTNVGKIDKKKVKEFFIDNSKI